MTEVNPPAYLQAAGEKHPSKLLRRAFAGLLQREGVADFSGDGTDLKVEEDAPVDLGVVVKLGGAFVEGDDSTHQGYYFVFNDAEVDVPLSTAPAAPNSRKDVIVARVNDNTEGGGATDDWEIDVIEGSAGNPPSEPALPASALKLAVVDVGSDVSSINNGNITDSRQRPTIFTPPAQDAEVSTLQTTTSTSYTDLATSGPAVTIDVPASGKVLVVLYARLFTATNGKFAAMSFALSGANTASAANSKALLHQSNNAFHGSATVPLSGLTPGSTTFTAKYVAEDAGAQASFQHRKIQVIPLPA